jgi:glutamine cyclotransferase
MTNTVLKYSIAFLGSAIIFFSCDSSDSTSTQKEKNRRGPVKRDFISIDCNTADPRINDTIQFSFHSIADSITFETVQATIYGRSYTTQQDNLFIATKDFLTGENYFDFTFSLSNGKTESQSYKAVLKSDVVPEKWGFEIVKKEEHNRKSYTQGFFIEGDVLYEGTGMKGESIIRKVDRKNGKVLVENRLRENLFGEGIAKVNNRIYQLTWQSNLCLVYDAESLRLIEERPYAFQTEGWGLTSHNGNLYMSNGSEKIFVLDPATLNPVREIQAYTNTKPMMDLNELEYVDGLIYANIYQMDEVAVIEEKTGKVIATIDFSSLYPKNERRQDRAEVLNGIAYEKSSGHFYVTGKYWDRMYEIRIIKSSTASRNTKVTSELLAAQ